MKHDVYDRYVSSREWQKKGFRTRRFRVVRRRRFGGVHRSERRDMQRATWRRFIERTTTMPCDYDLKPDTIDLLPNAYAIYSVEAY